MSLEDNINARRRARELLELFDFENDPLAAAMMVEELQERHLPKKPPLSDEMTPEQSRQFKFEVMPFGAHAGKKVAEVPSEYLAWLVDNDFNSRLRKYLKTPEFVNRHD